jgi:DNA-binding response OmpR family regulator
VRRLLLVEDEPGLVMTLTDRLVAEGFEVECASDATRALAVATSRAFDIILLDVMLPGGSGFDVCKAVRERGVTAPIIMLTARGQVADRVAGLKLGADDYLVKPFEMVELLARIEALLRRATPALAPTADIATFGDVAVDFRRAEVTKNSSCSSISSRTGARRCPVTNC